MSRGGRTSERRRRPRARLRLDVGYEDAAGALFLRLRDLSESGALLEGDHRPPVGVPVRLVLELPGEPALQRLTGRVVRVVGPAQGGPAFAVAFDPAPVEGAAAGHDSASTRSVIRRTVERHLGWRHAS